jgi:transcriptional regulator with XRE-family HTH domain
MLDLRQTIEDLRAERGMTRQELCDKTGIHRTCLSLYFNGHRDFGSDKIEKILNVLGAKIVI